MTVILLIFLLVLFLGGGGLWATGNLRPMTP
jgi:hypothetical protein